MCAYIYADVYYGVCYVTQLPRTYVLQTNIASLPIKSATPEIGSALVLFLGFFFFFHSEMLLVAL